MILKNIISFQEIFYTTPHTKFMRFMQVTRISHLQYVKQLSLAHARFIHRIFNSEKVIYSYNLRAFSEVE